MARCHEDYGPIFRITGLAGDYIFVVGPEANRMVLHTHREAFSTAIGWGEILGLGEHLGHGLLSMDGAVHADHRRMMNPAFAVGHLGEYLRVMQRIIAGCVAGWAARGTVDIFEEARGLTFAIAAETLAGLAPERRSRSSRCYIPSCSTCEMRLRSRAGMRSGTIVAICFGAIARPPDAEDPGAPLAPDERRAGNARGRARSGWTGAFG